MVNQREPFKARSRNATNRLLKIPLVQLIFSTVERSGAHDIGQRAAGVAYYAILSVFPLVLGLIAVFGFFLPSVNLQDELLKFVGKNLPGATDILQQNIDTILKLRGVMGVLSIIILFWGASGMFSAISLAINRAWDVKHHRPFFIRKAGELGMVLSMGILFLLSLGVSTFISIMSGVLNLSSSGEILVIISGRIVAFLLIFAVFLLLYKFVPYTKTHWRFIWQGALLTTVLFELARVLFIFYIENFANYQLVFGSVTSIIVLLIWTYYSAFIMIMGAEFTFQLSRMHKSVSPANEPVD
jgi:membrane protein